MVKLALPIALSVALILPACNDPVGVGRAAIAGGELSDREAVVALTIRSLVLGEFTCSGTVIGPYHVLTARHCVTADREGLFRDPTEGITVHFGPRRSTASRSIGVTEILLGGGEVSDFALEGRDIAVLITDEHTAVAPLLLADVDPSTDDPVTMVGYGEREGGEDGLRYEGTTTVMDVLPYDPTGTRLYSAIFFTGGGPSNVCDGDSGGPVIDDAGRVVGVASFGGRACDATMGAGFTSVASNRNFIDDALAHLPDCPGPDPSEGCGALEVTTVIEETLIGVEAYSVALVGNDVAVGDGARATVYEVPSLLIRDQVFGGGFFGESPVSADTNLLAVGLPDEVRIVSVETGTYVDVATLPLGTVDVIPFSLALRDRVIAVGAPGDPGRAYVNPDRIVGAFEPLRVDGSQSYGYTVGTDGMRVAVGAPREDVSVTGDGAVYLYTPDPASFAEMRIAAPDAADHDQFGTSVVITGGALFVGAPREDMVDGDAGAVYVFDLADLSIAVDVLRPEPESHGARFGSSLAVAGDRLIVGAPGRGIGAVYVFARRGDGTWGRVGRLDPTGTDVESGFGYAVAAAGDRIAVLGWTPDGMFFRPDTALGVYDVAPVVCAGTPSAPPPCIPPAGPDAGVADVGVPDAGGDAGMCVPDCSRATPGSCGMSDGCGGSCDMCTDGTFCAGARCELPVDPEDSGGCGCDLTQAETDGAAWLALLVLPLVAWRRRRG